MAAIKEYIDFYDQNVQSVKTMKEYSRITELRFGSVVTHREDTGSHYLILDTRGVDNIHGSFLHSDEQGNRYIIAGGGGTMSTNDFGLFVEQLSFDEAIEIVKLGWHLMQRTNLPEDLLEHFHTESKFPPIKVK